MVGFSLQSLASMGGLHASDWGHLGQWGFPVEEEAKTSWASHDVGRLLGGKSPAIHHFQGPRVVMRHEEVHGSWVLAGLGKEAFQA